MVLLIRWSYLEAFRVEPATMLIFFRPLGAFRDAVSTPFTFFSFSEGWHCGNAGVGLADVGAPWVRALMVVPSGTPAAATEPPTPANEPAMVPPVRLNDAGGITWLVTVVGVILAVADVYEMVESYLAVLGGVADNRPEQVSAVAAPRFAGSLVTLNLRAVTDAVATPSVTVPVQVPLPLMVMISGPLAANRVSAIAATAVFGSEE